jgi:hypothetical protein
MYSIYGLEPNLAKCSRDDHHFGSKQKFLKQHIMGKMMNAFMERLSWSDEGVLFFLGGGEGEANDSNLLHYFFLTIWGIDLIHPFYWKQSTSLIKDQTK